MVWKYTIWQPCCLHEQWFSCHAVSRRRATELDTILCVACRAMSHDTKSLFAWADSKACLHEQLKFVSRRVARHRVWPKLGSILTVLTNGFINWSICKLVKLLPGTDVMIFKIFLPKNFGKKWRFLLETKLIFFKLIISLVFKKNANFFAQNWQKIVFITSTHVCSDVSKYFYISDCSQTVRQIGMYNLHQSNYYILPTYMFRHLFFV
jgi:hypothetical protein